jgi:sugar phosphate isomerase/epimerase
MQLGRHHLTYCLNVHPGESWAETFETIRTRAMAVRDAVAPGERFGLGLRISALAAEELLAGAGALDALKQFLDDSNCYAFTINGFPFGQFHETAVKHNVYQPDWREQARVDYTLKLAEILAAILPEGVNGSISTVPCSYKTWITTDDDVRAMVANLCEVAAACDELLTRTGRCVTIALEPEPDCYLETTAEAIAFFTGPLRSMGLAYLAETCGLNADVAEAILRKQIGLCFDTSHQAVEFEEFAASINALQDAGITIAKFHLSSALEVSGEATDALEPFVEPVYLHQTKVRKPDGTVDSYADLPDALAAGSASADETWRVHFHMPLFWAGDGPLRSTQRLLAEAMDAILAVDCEHLEIETYTFGVLPEFLAASDLPVALAQEYRWVLAQLPPR